MAIDYTRMNFQQIAVLLPCLGLDEFPAHLEGADARELLGAWAISWHPELLASVERLPAWHPADSPPDHLPDTLILLPEISRQTLPTGWLERINADSFGAHLQTAFPERPWNLHEVLGLPDEACNQPEHNASQEDHEKYEEQPLAERSECPASTRSENGEANSGSKTSSLNHEIIERFFALGFCYLMVEIISHRMRYSSNVDTSLLQEHSIAAAKAAVSGDNAQAKEHIQAAYDVLHSARDYCYPAETYNIDLLLLAPSVFGEAFIERLKRPIPTNVLVSGQLIEQMAKLSPQSLAALREAIQNGTACLLGGEYQERPLSLISTVEWIAELEHGKAVYEKHLGCVPKIFARHNFQLIPTGPQILQAFGFQAAVAVNFTGRILPHSEQSRVTWEGVGSFGLDCLWKRAADFAQAETMLAFGNKTSDSMDHDFVATQLFAGWPGTESCWYNDFVATMEYGTMLGEFVTLEHYFETVAETGSAQRVTELIPGDALSLLEAGPTGIVSHLQRTKKSAIQNATRRIKAMRRIVAPGSTIAEQTISVKKSSSKEITMLHNAQAALKGVIAPVSAELVHGNKKANASEKEQSGHLVINPVALECSVPYISKITSSDSAAPVLLPPNRLAKNVPVFGFAWHPASKQQKSPAPLAEGTRLQNEEITVEVDPVTGAVTRIGGYNLRGACVAQQLALRSGEQQNATATSEAVYSIMAADSVDIRCSNDAVGELVSKGRLLNRQGEAHATFEQTLRLARASRHVEMEIAVTPLQALDAFDSNNYFAIRFACPSKATIGVNQHGVFTSCHDALTKNNGWIVAQDWLQFTMHNGSCSLFPHGLPLHRCVSERMFETLLPVEGTKLHRFRFAIGVNIPDETLSPLAEAITWQEFLPALPSRPPASHHSGWLMHLDSSNVTIIDLTPSSRCDRSLRIMLQESFGQKTEATLRFCREIVKVARLNTENSSVRLDQPTHSIRTEGNKFSVDIGPHEFVAIEVTF